MALVTTRSDSTLRSMSAMIVVLQGEMLLFMKGYVLELTGADRCLEIED